MAEESFRPPEYEETMHLLFEKETGKVMASERRWTLVREMSQAEQPVRSDVLGRVISGLGRREEDFEVLVLRGPAALEAPPSRVDVRLRKPVREEDHAAKKGAGPSRIEGP